jgi:hypothetical protein
MKFSRYFVLALIVFFFNACATYNAQYKETNIVTKFPEKEIAHSFYLIGDAGNSPIGTETEALKDFKEELNKANQQSTALFLGDNIYPAGMPKKGHEQREFAEHQLNVQMESAKDFKGKAIFIPGNHDWYAKGLNGLKRQENYIENRLGKNTFLPENGCPIENVDISDNIVMIIIDTEWYLTNWDKHPTINDDCKIKTRDQFFLEYESLIKKAQGKTTIIAMHHPMYTNGSHGGQYDFKSNLKPVPIIGSLKNVLRKTSGVSPQDLQNKKYRELKKRLVTLSQSNNDKLIFVSGHDHNLQYIVQDNLPQIISGSGSKINATRNVRHGQFSFGAKGYARLDVFKDGSSYVRFYEAETNKVVFQTEVLPTDKKDNQVNYDTTFPKEKTASIYTKEETKKSGFYKTLWGDRYRKHYSTNIKAPTVNLDTLFGGLSPIRKGGGHQSKSLRLQDNKGHEYVMRALRKNAVQYLQVVAFKDQYIEGHFEYTYTEGLLLDIFTGAHPYAPFTIGTMAEAVGIYHTNPVLYYIPKQNALGQFNDEFGGELYMIEERPADGYGDSSTFGFSNEIISTNDMLSKLRKNENHSVDEKAYVRARLFDMLIGDWDRHEDQWRWAVFKNHNKTIYRPIPRDHDQAFSIMSDGALLSFATTVFPTLRLMKSYDEDIKSVKWFNLEPYSLDKALINQADRTLWDNQVKHIVANLTNEVIDDAFTYFPKETNDEIILDIKNKLIGRRNNLQKISDEYYKHINKYAIVKGTDKDDWFDIERLPEGKTKITGYRIKKGEKATVFHERTYTYHDTKEIWIYGLDDTDIFHVFGDENCITRVRLIGGQNNDSYNIENGERVKIYDFKSKKSEFTTNKGDIKLTNDYETNVYNYNKIKNNSNQIIPTIGANQDDGLKIGAVNTYTKYGFERNPFTSQHILRGAYYFSTDGFEFNYNGEFANIIRRWNFGFEAVYTSPNYSINFFGFGNETVNLNEEDQDNFDLDYNRVKISTLKFSPSLIWRGKLGASIKVGMSFESIDVEKTNGRFINTVTSVFDNGRRNNFLGGEVSYSFVNKDNKAYPTLGFQTSLQIGYKSNVEESKSFGYIIPSMAFDYKLEPSGQLVLATKFKGHVNLGNDFEFYQAASLGASDGLRGYRNQRFTGESSFYQSTDLRLNLRKVKTSIIPLYIGVYGGVDYGRVWYDGENSNKWNNSFGGGIFINGANLITGNLSAFNSDDSLRIAFALGFTF